MVPMQNQDPDPVFQLEDMFDAWRADLEGRPDALQSVVTFEPSGPDLDLVVELRDWQLLPISTPILSVTATHAANSAGIMTIGSVIDEGGGFYRIPLTSGVGDGLDVIEIVVDDGIRTVTLIPRPSICHGDLGDDCNGNGIRDDCDIVQTVSCDDNNNGVPDECEAFFRGDCNHDGSFQISDAIFGLGVLFPPNYTPVCEDACDANNDGAFDLADPIYILDTLFGMGPPPPAPFPGCGIDHNIDPLLCEPLSCP